MRRVLVLAVALTTVATLGCDETITIDPVPVVVTLNIAPDPAPSLLVGQTLQLVAIVSGTQVQTATWTSSNSSVISVHATTGLASCVSPGVAVVTAVSAVDATARDAVTVQCAVPQALIDITPTTLAFTHKVGSSPCSQSIGTVQVTNRSQATIQVAITGHSALSVDAVSFTLAPGASRNAAVSFNCSTQTSFVGTMTLTATGGGTTDAKSVQVTGTIN